MNDMLAVLKLLGERRIRTRIAARFPLETSPDLVGRIVVLPWAQPRSGDRFDLCPASCGVVPGIAKSGSVRGSGCNSPGLLGLNRPSTPPPERPLNGALSDKGIGYLSAARQQVLTRCIIVIKMESDECRCRTRTSFTVLPIDRPRLCVCYKLRSISQ